MRARNIKPGFYHNELLASLNPLARILFSGLWCLADSEGRLEDRPGRIKVQILPYDNCDVDSLLNDLDRTKFIARYETEGDKYIQINGFHKHQKPHYKEPKSVIPGPKKTYQSSANDKSMIDRSSVNDKAMIDQSSANQSGPLGADSGFRIADSGFSDSFDTAQAPLASQADKTPPMDELKATERAKYIVRDYQEKTGQAQGTERRTQKSVAELLMSGITEERLKASSSRYAEEFKSRQPDSIPKSPWTFFGDGQWDKYEGPPGKTPSRQCDAEARAKENKLRIANIPVKEPNRKTAKHGTQTVA